MSAPRIKVVFDYTGHDDVPPFVWFCQQRGCDGPSAEGETYTIAAAADAGRAHLAAHHTALMPQVAHGDGDDANGPQSATCEVCDGTGHVECWLLECPTTVCECCGPCRTCGTDDAELYGICETHDMPPTACFGLHVQAVQPFVDFEQAINRAHTTNPEKEPDHELAS